MLQVEEHIFYPSNYLKEQQLCCMLVTWMKDKNEMQGEFFSRCKIPLKVGRITFT